MAVHMIVAGVGLSGCAPPADAAKLKAALQAHGAAGSARACGAGRAVFAAAAAARPNGAPPAPPSQAEDALYETDRVLVLADAYFYRSADGTPSGAAARRIAAAYESEGEAGLDRLEGDYVFAIFDKAADRLLVRRDPFGVRPVFVSHRPGAYVAFATLPEFLLDAGLAGTARDWTASQVQIASLSPGPEATLLKDVRRLRPGRQAVADADTVSERRHFTPEPAPGAPRAYGPWLGELKRRFEAAVARRLPAHGVVASHLTSGLDSAGVALTAAKMLPDESPYLDAYCIGASEEARAFTRDETDAAARAAASSNRVNFTAVRADPADEFGMTRELSDRLCVAGGPHQRAALAAAMNGAEVFLSGLGGDQSVSYTGWGVGADLLRRGRWKQARRYFRDERRKGKSRIRVAAHMVIPLLGPTQLTFPIYKRLAGRGQARDTALSMSGLKRARLREIRSHYADFGADTIENQKMQFELGVIHNQLEHYARIGLAAGVRYTFPLLDTRLVAWSMTCRPEHQFRDGMSRAPMRDLLKGVLPDETRLMTKNALLPVPEIPYRVAQKKASYLGRLDRLEADPRLHDWFDFKRVRRELEAIEDPQTVRARLAEHAEKGGQGPVGGTTPAFMALFRMEAMQRWLDAEGEAPHEPRSRGKRNGAE